MSYGLCCKWLIGWIALLCCCVVVHAETASATFQNAVDTYQQALQISDRDERLMQFHRAVKLFQRLLEPNYEGVIVQNADL
jgi:hypothetical protein